MTQQVLAVDMGGTHTRVALVNMDGTLASRRDEPTPLESNQDSVVAFVGGLMEAVAGAAAASPAGACIAVAGLVNGVEGRVIVAPNIPAFRNLALAAPLAARLGFPVALENDASAAALGEFRFGAGRGARNLLHDTVGTGIGGGIVAERRLYRGSMGFAGEIGHMIIDPAGPSCACGGRGCLEALVSGVAFAARAQRLLARDASPVLKEIAGYREPTSADLFAAATAGDRLCEAEIRNGGHILGLGIGSLVNILNPDAVTLSGGMLAMGGMFLDPMHAAVRGMAYASTSNIDIRVSTLDDDAGILGAAAVAFENAG